MSNRVIEGRAVSNEPWYKNYRAMMDRCYREKAANYPQYGGRGIKVCPGWHHIEIFEAWALDNGYKPGLTLDRIDPDGDYTPTNCRWATPKQQANNRIGGVDAHYYRSPEEASEAWNRRADNVENLEKQAEGLEMIRDGLETQMNLTKHRLKHLKEMKKTETKEYISLTAAFKTQTYWFKEADKALNGDLHF